ncbi:hypothetical protein HRI_000533700 [Hibiscus trionum]|uniref:F-box domain-containing protein n=1 Tax=Hibiscus trionum TaxID=183268 RepID=A0A9W7LLD9_HIBTR|nr:hypothetical protein HRI_000533700 [Hibiscus trionum]
MRIIKYMFHAYKTCFNLLRGCSSFSNFRPWLKLSTSKVVVHAPWDQLDVDISCLIFQCLDLEDRVRFNLVCKQWKKNTEPTSQPLWLMLPYEPNNKYLSFFDICDGKVHKLNLPQSVQGGWFCGCSKGWLFLALGTTLRNLRIFLFDPISRAQIPLPSLSMISSFEDCLTGSRFKWNPAAYIIDSIEPSSSDASQCIVAATFCEKNTGLALCRLGDERWTIVEGLLAEGYRYGGIIFFDGELYASVISLDEENNNNQAPFQFHSITIGNQRVHLKLIYSTHPPPSLFYANGVLTYTKNCSRCSCLVESNGQLLMVTQTWDAICTLVDEEEEGDDGLLVYIQAATFQVFKIKTTEDTMCITRLTGLGNQSLFLGTGDCRVLENPNKFGKNCIHFLQVFDYRSDKRCPLVCREAGVYHLDDGSIKRCFPSIKTKSSSSMHWFSPNF